MDYGALSWWAWQNQRGKKTQNWAPGPSGCPREQMGPKWGHVPKAQRLKRRGRGPRPCNRKDAKRGDRQTNRLSAHYSKIYTIM